MSENNKSYRIRTGVGKGAEKNIKIDVNLLQDYDTLEILSLKIDTESLYKTHTSNYGCLVGRVLANGGVGVPNVKVSVFIEASNDDIENPIFSYLYPYKSTFNKNADDIRYNLLPDSKVNECHQVIGTFPNKRLVLDDDNVIEIYDSYYKFTTVTNTSGDYMIFGLPVGNNMIHSDLDLSDIGILSQKPRDLFYKGYSQSSFENSSMFKKDTNLDNLTQVMSTDTSVYVYPFWGDEEDNREQIKITRSDIDVPYKFEPTCIFIGSVVTDEKSNAISKNCIPSERGGKMDRLTTGKGTIEMIRKDIHGEVESFSIQGNELIDGNGTWCYQIPMNLDYMTTDEYGELVPTDNTDIGLPTRAEVRFRMSVQNYESEYEPSHLVKVLVPNNVKSKSDVGVQGDYVFGTDTSDESFRSLFWNNVYTVKSYIPRYQKGNRDRNKNFTGIKAVNVNGANNPMPYNNMRVNLTFLFVFQCIIFKCVVIIIKFLNKLIHAFNRFNCDVSSTGMKGPTLIYVTMDGSICPALEGHYVAPGAKEDSRLCSNTYKNLVGEAFNLDDGEKISSITVPSGSIISSDPKSSDVKNNATNSITLFRKNAFYYADIDNIILPDSLGGIGESAFYGSTLKSIFIPQRTEIIDTRAFQECHSLTDVSFESKKPCTIGNWVFYDVSGIPLEITIHIPIGTTSEYRSGAYWYPFAKKYEDKYGKSPFVEEPNEYFENLKATQVQGINTITYYSNTKLIEAEDLYDPGLHKTSFNVPFSEHKYDTSKKIGKILFSSSQIVQNKQSYDEDGKEDWINIYNNEDYFVKCVELQFAMEYEVIQFDFYNDWINGCIYIPRWVGEVKRNKDNVYYCNAENTKNKRFFTQQCAVQYLLNSSYTIDEDYDFGCNDRRQLCHKKSGRKQISIGHGLVKRQKTIYDQFVHYPISNYVIEDNGVKKSVNMFATDVVMLGSVDKNNIYGIPLINDYPSSTYIMPPPTGEIISDLQEMSISTNVNSQGITWESHITKFYTFNKTMGEPDSSGDTQEIEMSGIDWGYNPFSPNNVDDTTQIKNQVGGHFLEIGCTRSLSNIKSCVNLGRICEIGSEMSQSHHYSYTRNKKVGYHTLRTTGVITKREVIDNEIRSLFSSLNSNNLSTENDSGSNYKKYSFQGYYPNTFSGDLQNRGEFAPLSGSVTTTSFYFSGTSIVNTSVTFNYNMIEDTSKSYIDFRFNVSGNTNNRFLEKFITTWYDSDKSKHYGYIPMYENSFYFYFGLKNGNTAIDRLYSEYFAQCTSDSSITLQKNKITPIVYSTETWVFNQTPDTTKTISFDDINFTCDGDRYVKIRITSGSYADREIEYVKEDGTAVLVYGFANKWVDKKYRTIIVTIPTSNDFKTYLEKNAELEKERWVLNKTITLLDSDTTLISTFISNGKTYDSITFLNVPQQGTIPSHSGMTYSDGVVSEIVYKVTSGSLPTDGWKNEAYRTIDVYTPIPANFKTFLENNGVKQG